MSLHLQWCFDLSSEWILSIQLWRTRSENLQVDAVVGCVGTVNGNIKIFCHLVKVRQQGEVHPPAEGRREHFHRQIRAARVFQQLERSAHGVKLVLIAEQAAI